MTASSLRMNNSTMYSSTDGFAVLVNPNDLASGTCYAVPAGGGSAATPESCGTGNSVPLGPPGALRQFPLATYASLTNSYGQPAPIGTNGEDLSAATLAGYTCGTGSCSLYTVENGLSGKYNTVTPQFAGLSLTDEWRPTDRLLVNVGLRFDQYKYIGDNTTGTAARAFWFNAFNNDTCYNT